MFLRYNLFGILWGLLILLLSFLPKNKFPDIILWDQLAFDKAAHIIMYFIFVLMLIVGLKKQYTYRQFRYNAVKYAFTIGFIYGLIIEVLQEIIIFDRNTEITDIWANTIGCVIACIVFFVIYGRKLAG